VHENENALLKVHIGPSLQVTESVLGTLPRWGSRVRVPSSAPRKDSLTSGNAVKPKAGTHFVA
jgi:hypothetical protein